MKTKKTPAPKRAGNGNARLAREIHVGAALVTMSEEDPQGLAEILGQFPELSSVFIRK